MSSTRAATWRRAEIVVTEGAIVVSVVAIALQTRLGSGPSRLTIGDLAVLVVLAMPALVAVPLTTQRWLRHPACLVALLAWVPLAVTAGDLSCVDCGLALILPVMFAVPQAALLFTSLTLQRDKHEHPDLRL